MSANPYSPPATGYQAYQGAPNPGSMAGVGPTEMTVEMLRQTRPWVLFLSVLSFIGAAFMLLGGVVMMFAGALAGGKSGLGSAIPGAVLGAIYIPLALLYIYPAIKLWKYGSSIGQLVANRSSEDLETALGHQKSFWKFAGITTLVLMVVYFLAIIGMVVVGVVGAASMRH